VQWSDSRAALRGGLEGAERQQPRASSLLARCRADRYPARRTAGFQYSPHPGGRVGGGHTVAIRRLAVKSALTLPGSTSVTYTPGGVTSYARASPRPPERTCSRCKAWNGMPMTPPMNSSARCARRLAPAWQGSTSCTTRTQPPKLVSSWAFAFPLVHCSTTGTGTCPTTTPEMPGSSSAS
jgi:hypothetical protein